MLSDAVVPTGYNIALTTIPSEDNFSGQVRIAVNVNRATDTIYLHGDELEVSAVTIEREGEAPITATYEQVDDTGVAKLTLAQAVPEGPATIAFVYTAPFNRALRGLYRVDVDGESYAFTQFESTSARLCFPSFDEPRFKVPFDLTLTIRADHEAAANTPIEDTQELPDGMKRVRFATSRPMPTYLVAMTMGPLDVVTHAPIQANDHRSVPLPLRGLAVKGKGAQLAYALENTERLLRELEAYFGRPYPYAKLDIVAVPDFAAGAMENVGLVTFRETLLLVAPDAPERQRRAYAYVMAHELAHMWFGNLVTMVWWDDIWLNEAFATWMGYKATEAAFPTYHADQMILSSVIGAMGQDSLVTARQIRQPIESNHDIRNAFDSITYRKGGGVLAMFERYLGEETFRDGIRLYMQQNEWGNATFEGLLSALSEASGRDVATPFRTFLFQPGLPFLNVTTSCEDGQGALAIAQSRYLPVGSTGSTDSTWQVPMCARYGVGDEVKETCVLITEQTQSVALEGCASWVMPNANGAGYFRFALDAEGMAGLRGAWSQLTPREKMIVADSIAAAFDNASTSASDLFDSLDLLASDEIRSVAEAPMSLLEFARERLAQNDEERAKIEALSRRLYQPVLEQLGWEPGARESGDTMLLRASVIAHLAMVGRDPAVRAEAARRGTAYLGHGGDEEIHPDAVDSNLVGTCIAIAVQDGEEAIFEHVMERALSVDDALLRGHLLSALGHVDDPAHSQRAMALALDERVPLGEVWRVIFTPFTIAETRAGAWNFLTTRFDDLKTRMDDGVAWLPRLTAAFCSEGERQQAETFFTPRVEELPGAPRNLANGLERSQLCIAKVAAHRESADAFFAR